MHGKLELTGAVGFETNGGSNSRKHTGSWRQPAISLKCCRLQGYCNGGSQSALPQISINAAKFQACP